MNQMELEIARLNASLAVANGELKLANTRPKPAVKALSSLAVVLGLGVGVGFGLGFTSVGIEQYLRQGVAQIGTAVGNVLP